MNYLYIIRCEGGFLYTGITKDLKRRMAEHFYGKKKAAKYTRQRKPKELCMAWTVPTWQEACRLEYFIKTLTKKQKENLLTQPMCLGDMFAGKRETGAPECAVYGNIQNYPTFLQDFLLKST